jgi:hypothetical protein
MNLPDMNNSISLLKLQRKGIRICQHIPTLNYPASECFPIFRKPLHVHKVPLKSFTTDNNNMNKMREKATDNTDKKANSSNLS